MPVKKCIALSTTGSLTRAIIKSGVPIEYLAADREEDRKCFARKISEDTGIPLIMVPRSFEKSSFDRLEYTQRFIAALREREIGAVFMAGFNTILHAIMFEPENYQWRITNTHPALLPQFPGHYAVRDALAAGVSETGCTIHHATEVMDDPRYIIAQESVPVVAGDTEDSLWERIKVAERALYPKVINAFMAQLEAGTMGPNWKFLSA